MSGLVLALFVPIHLLVVAQALAVDNVANEVAHWSSSTAFRFVQVSLIGLLTVHMIGGIRIICIEYFGLVGGQFGWLVTMLTVTSLTVALLLVVVMP